MYKFKPGQLQPGLYNITSSLALTASYALNASAFPYSGSAVITGSLTIKSDVNDIFLIKNFAGNNIFTVSQSGVVVLATQSIELSNPAPNGGMYFTSGAFFVGLDM
jgi:hypothetical protein